MVIKMIKNLRKLRLENGISQQQLGEILLVSQQSINKYENHNVEPDVQGLIKIANYFNVSIDYLLGRTEIKEMVEHIEPSEFSQEEIKLISKFRSLNEEQKKTVMSVAESYK